ncbi:hypothetical protein NRS6120_13590 [Bacillus subtilis]|nr:hypothetical protein [Bacillus subtilis]CAF1739033.1 Inosamine-phosphate amidinotransferase 1 [Bacillus subtilis]CAI6287090.1 hypothetical protein NRS6120_13590 [Bacillus subtilis]
MAYEPALAPYFPKGSEESEFLGGPVSQEEIDKAQQQLDNLASVLESEGIIVKRPDYVNHNVTVKTPDFEIPCGNSTACPRDVLLVIGDEIIEAPMAQRARFFEYRAYRSLIKEYFKNGSRWSATPKPLMSDDLYNLDYDMEEKTFDAEKYNSITHFEPCFDAATFVRFGRDIFYQPDVVTNDFGAQWLQRHLGDEYRIHRVRFKDPHPQHLDTTLVPLRPGLVMINPERPCIDDTLNLFRQNNWEIVEAPSSVRGAGFHSPEVSNWISMNVLLLDVDKVVVDIEEEPMIRFLEKLGFKVITCPFGDVLKFGGSFHCCTTDIRRRGILQSYFPSLD